MAVHIVHHYIVTVLKVTQSCILSSRRGAKAHVYDKDGQLPLNLARRSGGCPWALEAELLFGLCGDWQPPPESIRTQPPTRPASDEALTLSSCQETPMAGNTPFSAKGIPVADTSSSSTFPSFASAISLSAYSPTSASSDSRQRTRRRVKAGKDKIIPSTSDTLGAKRSFTGPPYLATPDSPSAFIGSTIGSSSPAPIFPPTASPWILGNSATPAGSNFGPPMTGPSFAAYSPSLMARSPSPPALLSSGGAVVPGFGGTTIPSDAGVGGTAAPVINTSASTSFGLPSGQPPAPAVVTPDSVVKGDGLQLSDLGLAGPSDSCPPPSLPAAAEFGIGHIVSLKSILFPATHPGDAAKGPLQAGVLGSYGRVVAEKHPDVEGVVLVGVWHPCKGVYCFLFG